MFIIIKTLPYLCVSISVIIFENIINITKKLWVIDAFLQDDDELLTKITRWASGIGR